MPVLGEFECWPLNKISVVKVDRMWWNSNDRTIEKKACRTLAYYFSVIHRVFWPKILKLWDKRENFCHVECKLAERILFFQTEKQTDLAKRMTSSGNDTDVSLAFLIFENQLLINWGGGGFFQTGWLFLAKTAVVQIFGMLRCDRCQASHHMPNLTFQHPSSRLHHKQLHHWRDISYLTHICLLKSLL